MNIWEKTIVNVQKGYERLTALAAAFSERARAEVNIVRIRLRIDGIRARMDELHRIIGFRVMELKTGGNIPKTTEQMLKDDDIAGAASELTERERELADLNEELRSVQTDFNPDKKHSEEDAAE